jgi:hypothetical protein
MAPIDVIAIRMARKTHRRADALAAQAKKEIDLARLQKGCEGRLAYFYGLQKLSRADSLKRTARKWMVMHTKKNRPQGSAATGHVPKEGQLKKIEKEATT